MSCDYCSRSNYPKLLRDDSFNLPQPGYIGAKYRDTRVLLVGQNPGASPDRFRLQDRQFADAQVSLRDDPNAGSLASLHDVNDAIMRTWPVVANYFPLAESGLHLNDIAYVNVVRCRTRGNATPGVAIARACISRHFVRWLDWLEPRVVICIGKWAHDNISGLLEERGIPNGFANRRRSLSSAERRENRKSIAALVRGVTSGSSTSVCRQPRTPKPPKAPAVRPVDDDYARTQSATKRRPAMAADGYRELFRSLGFHEKERPNDDRTLKHKKKAVPSLYFNRSGGLVCFVGYLSDEHRYPASLWDRIPPRKRTDDKPSLITIVPKAGKEEEAFAALLG